ncbi:MAG: biotin--[acetyl-CoA-carboxylase] ligase [Candidatus Bathyarchaeota archaeon]|nr:biotin--[acetyl-CoA-carboxylase] ligase [Candidatus Bathyarchaeota archaeon]
MSSTNEIAKEIAKTSDEERVVIIAETQTLGKGRIRRRWISPRGGIWLSIILRPRILSRDASKLTFIMSSTVANSIKRIFGLNAEVKWPNDVLVRSRKICGILTEISTRTGIVQFVIIGLGINANIDLLTFPRTLRKKVTSLKQELGYSVNLRRFTESLLCSFENNYKRFHRGEWHTLLSEWKALATFFGRQVKVTSLGETVVGEALDVGTDGALKIKLKDGTLREIVAGDLTLI